MVSPSQATAAARGSDFEVRRVAVEELTDENAFVVALSENADGTSCALIFQASLELDEQDEALDMDTYCLSNEQGASAYGGIRSLVLADRIPTLNLDDGTADVLSLGEECSFSLLIDDESLAALREGLRRLFSLVPRPPGELVL